MKEIKEYTGLELTYKDWVLRADPRKQYSHLFDLHVWNMADEKVKKNGKWIKTGKRVPSLQFVGYGMTLETAIDRIVRQSVAHDNDKLELKNYKGAIKKEKEHLQSILKN